MILSFQSKFATIPIEKDQQTASVIGNRLKYGNFLFFLKKAFCGRRSLAPCYDAVAWAVYFDAPFVAPFGFSRFGRDHLISIRCGIPVMCVQRGK